MGDHFTDITLGRKKVNGMYEKVNPMHPDKIADRIAGAIVDMAYENNEFPKIAVEILIGHGECHIIMETSVNISGKRIKEAVRRIAQESLNVTILTVPQDKHLSENQLHTIKCGDNGIFKGVPETDEQVGLREIAENIYNIYHSDGKYIIDGERLIVCQSKANKKELKEFLEDNYALITTVNPIGDWTGGINVDSGATNRKLGSDMGDSVTGGGLHGKDLSKADVSVNIYAWLKAQRTGKEVNLCCAIGDQYIDGKPYADIVEEARKYIKRIGGFEKFAEWGLI